MVVWTICSIGKGGDGGGGVGEGNGRRGGGGVVTGRGQGGEHVHSLKTIFC